jgi:hypothetical protein
MKHLKRINEKTYSSWELRDKIDKILSDNIKEIPYEGTEVDKYRIVESFMELIYELSPEYNPNKYFNSEDEL